MPTHSLGWKRQLPDFRDWRYPYSGKPVLPPSADLRALCPPVYDQGQLGSCVANAIAGAIEVAQKVQAKPTYTASRLMIYKHARLLEGTVNVDAGCSIRDGMKTVATTGAAHEDLWPYDITKFRDNPPKTAWHDAACHQVARYESIDQQQLAMKTRISSGLPFVGGIAVYSSFESPTVNETGVIPMPAPGDSALGGHAILFVGYDDASRHFIFRNSWGIGWGAQGYGFLPYNYLLDPNLASDFWTVDLVK